MAKETAPIVSAGSVDPESRHDTNHFSHQPNNEFDPPISDSVDSVAERAHTSITESSDKDPSTEPVSHPQATGPIPDDPVFTVATEEEEEFFDGDSAFGANSAMTETESISSSIMKLREENGRTYHSFGSTEHWGPCDEDALDQQDISHHFWSLMLKGELYLAPIRNPQKVLDLGCGTGIWVIDVAEKHPSADVKGIDVAPIQPSWVPPNARFELDDFNLNWGDENKYDLIHQRELLGSVTDWGRFYEQCFNSLKPGGWVDCTEPSAFFESNYHDIPAYQKWGQIMLESGDASGMQFHVGPFIKQRLEDAGFINVVERTICCTIGAWSSDPWEREVGVWEQLRLETGVQLFCERRCINNLGWLPEEVTVFGAEMRAAIRNKKLLAHHWFYLVIGQKPPGAIGEVI